MNTRLSGSLAAEYYECYAAEIVLLEMLSKRTCIHCFILQSEVRNSNCLIFSGNMVSYTNIMHEPFGRFFIMRERNEGWKFMRGEHFSIIIFIWS